MWLVCCNNSKWLFRSVDEAVRWVFKYKHTIVSFTIVSFEYVAIYPVEEK